ncbi:MAG: LysM peptidoglycan-binding domain-containing protein [SAR86 cluster bacterium]|uniref:LysM peptidoglycan-binding domain-containing protein n=1 Tax=SAR86 cluster bacterium TaxID=2030880 RepID=A0A520N3E4_9GAMM|nr:MAG: LysM peptidoglycan-binding domain-containing protein [SAR86 cluster bacterium]
MERQLLTFFILITLIGCQQIEIIESYDEKQIQISTSDSEQSLSQDLVIPSRNIWEYMFANNPQNNRETINEQVLFYMNMHLKDIDKFKEYLNDSYYFMYFVIEELEKEQLPLELSLIPYIESNYDPFSISSSGAVGMWQFMPRTGRLYELNKTWWNEDRHDPYRSSQAAVGYLKYLYNRFGQDIYLTLAAYNAGPTLLDRRINQNKRRGLETDFWSLSLPNQTKEYVPKYLALKELVFNAEKYELLLPDIPNSPVVRRIKIPGQVEIITLSEFLDIKPELLYKLNAGYTKWASAPKDESIFYIPIDKYFLFESEANPFQDTNQINWISHVVESGDSLWALASKYDTEVQIIEQINFLNNDLLTIGSTLLIPLSKTPTNNFIPYEMHIVSEGDTLWDIANTYNLQVSDLAKMNSIDERSYLQLGQQLTIGNKNIHRNIESKKRTILYSIKQGDNLYKISELFDVTIKSIEEINDFSDDSLMPGQIIKIAIRAF